MAPLSAIDEGFVVAVHGRVDEETIGPQTPNVTRDTLRGFALLLTSTVISMSFGWGIAAYAVNANNMVGNPNYDNACVNGGPNGGGTVCRTDNAGWTFYMDSLNRPGSDGGSQSMEDESHGSTKEVPRRVA